MASAIRHSHRPQAAGDDKAARGSAHPVAEPRAKAKSAKPAAPAHAPRKKQMEARVLPFPIAPELRDPALGQAVQRVNFALARAVFDSDAEMAQAFGVDRSNMLRWKAGEPMSPRNGDRLHAFNTAVTMLLGFLSASTIPKWLRGINAHVGNRRPIDVLLNGRLSEVVAAIENERSGAFA